MAEREPWGGSPLGRGLRWGEGETSAIPCPEGEATNLRSAVCRHPGAPLPFRAAFLNRGLGVRVAGHLLRAGPQSGPSGFCPSRPCHAPLKPWAPCPYLAPPSPTGPGCPPSPLSGLLISSHWVLLGRLCFLERGCHKSAVLVENDGRMTRPPAAGARTSSSGQPRPDLDAHQEEYPPAAWGEWQWGRFASLYRPGEALREGPRFKTLRKSSSSGAWGVHGPATPFSAPAGGFPPTPQRPPAPPCPPAREPAARPGPGVRADACAGRHWR